MGAFIYFHIIFIISTIRDLCVCFVFLQVCPICSVKVSRDMLSHITLQHAHLFKISFAMKSFLFLSHTIILFELIYAFTIAYCVSGIGGVSLSFL